MKKKLSDKAWHAAATENAKHRAALHIEVGNAPKIAEVLKDIPVATALEFLFTQAEKYRRENKHSKTAVILEAASLIDRTTGQATELELKTSGSGKNEETTLSVRRYTPDEIFDSPIEYQETIEEA